MEEQLKTKTKRITPMIPTTITNSKLSSSLHITRER